MSQDDVLAYTVQGLPREQIARIIKQEVSDVDSALTVALDRLKMENGQLPNTILLELARLDKLVSVMFDQLLNAEDIICEMTGKMIKTKFDVIQNSVETIRKLTEAKAKLLQVSITYKASMADEEKEKVDNTNYGELSLKDKLLKFRDLLDE